jgi:hypothetical protein
MVEAHDSLHCDRNVIASEAKHPHEIATSSHQSGTPRNDQFWLFEVNYFMLPLVTSNFPFFISYFNGYEKRPFGL